MTTKLIIPKPGLIALQCKAAGEAAVLSLLGIGVIESGGTPFEDQRISDSYAALAQEPDPAKTLLAYYAEVVRKHPHVSAHLEPFTGFLRSAPEDQITALRKAAQWLSTISISGAEAAALADLLGRVLTETVALANKRLNPGHAYNINEASADLALRILLEDITLAEGMRFADMWADTGMRAIALATYQRNQGWDATKTQWFLFEADPMRRAILAVNTVAWELGSNVVIGNGLEHKKATIAAAQNGTAPLHWATEIPPDVLSMVRDG